jgi:ferric-dicitrate binding protein FerR (iron transport regulator)
MMRAAAVRDRPAFFPGGATLRRTGTSIVREALVLVSVLAVLFGGTAASEEPVAGTVTAVRGTAARKRLGSEKAAPVRIHDPYRVGDVLETGSGSTAQLTLSDETFLNMAADSAVRVNQYTFDRTTMRRTARIRVLKGSVRFVLFRPRSAGSLFHIETEQAIVLPQMIADIAVEARPGETDVSVLGGSAVVKSASDYIIGQLRVNMNQTVSVLPKTPPAFTAEVSPEDRRRLLNRLKVP